MSVTPPNFLASPLRVHRTPPQRIVDPQWTCQQSGECCSIPAEVILTMEELKEIQRFMLEDEMLHGIQVNLRTVGENKVAIQAHPCPLFIFNSCAVYPVRPYNCRRFGCMRPDPETEPFETGGPLDCKNLSERIEQSRPARRLYELIERRAQAWAWRHGWSK